MPIARAPAVATSRALPAPTNKLLPAIIVELVLPMLIDRAVVVPMFRTPAEATSKPYPFGTVKLLLSVVVPVTVKAPATVVGYRDLPIVIEVAVVVPMFNAPADATSKPYAAGTVTLLPIVTAPVKELAPVTVKLPPVLIFVLIVVEA